MHLPLTLHRSPCANGSRFASLLASLVLACATLLSVPAQAGVVNNPASIVDHGSYISDTVNHRDWYKFSNQLNTIGYSANGWAAAGLLPGWSMASIDQVQALETQFGWAGDTDVVGQWANFGLTYAMIDYLGYTAAFFSGANFDDGTYMIDAITADTYFFFNNATQDYDIEKRQVSSSRTYTIGNDFLTGDDVYGAQRFIGPWEGDDFTGIWLSRASLDGNPGTDCGRLAPCPPGQVPEPASGGLFLLALGALGMVRARRRAPVQASPGQA